MRRAEQSKQAVLFPQHLVQLSPKCRSGASQIRDFIFVLNRPILLFQRFVQALTEIMVRYKKYLLISG